MSTHPSLQDDIARLRHEERLVRAALAHAHREPAAGTRARERAGTVDRMLDAVRAHLGARRGLTAATRAP
jgi:hypothetical protein